jgi:HD-GYP domain-containing protein (c-di-GMP phosphodiesterase class II)
VGGNAPRGAARKRYAQAIQGARSLLTTTTLQDGLELRHGKRVVQPLVDGAFADEPVVVGLSSLTHKDEYTYAHAVNVCLISVTMGRLLDMDRRALADLGVASLLHDVGKAVVGDQIHHPLESFTDEERAAAERHPLEGALLLARSTTLNQTTLRCMRVALEHHMLPDGSGYPAASGRWPQSVMSRLVAVADCYVSLLGHRSQHGAVTTPYQALGMMLGPLKKRFDPAMLWALVQSVGFYPPGQLVLLDDGNIAAVLAPNAADLSRPHVRVVWSVTGQPMLQDPPLEYRPLPPERSIQRALKAEEYPTEPEEKAA